MGFIIYSIVIVVILSFYGLTILYKRHLLREVDGKHNIICKIFIGMAAALLDIFHRYIHEIPYEKVQFKLSQLTTERVTREDGYQYMISKLSIALCIFCTICGIGYGVCIIETFSERKEVRQITRPESEQGQFVYNLTAEHEKQRIPIDINVHPKDYSEKEVQRIFDESVPILEKVILNENSSMSHITSAIKLPESLDNGVNLEWKLDYEYMDYSGEIKWEQISEKKEVDVVAVLQLSGYERMHTFHMTLEPSKRTRSELISEELERLNQNTTDQAKLSLDEISKKYGVKFYKRKTNKYWIYFIFSVVTGIIVYIYIGKKMDESLNERKEELESDYASLVSKMMILQCSGMSLQGAWDKILNDYEMNHETKKILYKEMKFAREKMRNGYSEGQAYLEFGRRCGTHSYIKFSSLLEQNVKKGTKGLKAVLDDEVAEAFEIRKSIAKKRGDKAGTKLLIPMIIMLMISMMVIMIPAILSFQR